MASNFVAPNPVIDLNPFVDPQTGLLTRYGYWLLQSMRQSTVTTGQVSVVASVQVTPSGSNVQLDIAKSGPFGAFELDLVKGTQFTILPPIYTGGSLNAPYSIRLRCKQPAGGGAQNPLFSTLPGGFDSDLSNLVIVQEAETWTEYTLGLTLSGLWTLEAFQTGLAA